MNEYIIKKANNSVDWDKVESLNINYRNWGRPNPGIETLFKITWNSLGIYVYGRTKEEHILARADKPGCDVWRDSCMEFFFRPDEEDKRYFNFECNPNGAIYCGIGTNMPDRLRIIAQEEKKYFSISTNYTVDGWEMFLTIPISFIKMFFAKYELESNRILYANCHKCGADTIIPHSLSWNPYPMEGPVTFHNSDAFGKMILE